MQINPQLQLKLGTSLLVCVTPEKPRALSGLQHLTKALVSNLSNM